MNLNIPLNSLLNDDEHHDTTEVTGEKSAQLELSTGNPFVSMWTSEMTTQESTIIEETSDLSQTTQYMMTTNPLTTTELERSTAQSQITTQIPSFTTGWLLQSILFISSGLIITCQYVSKGSSLTPLNEFLFASASLHL